MRKIVPVILSGGSGTRLWPISTDSTPKQFLPLISNRSIFSDTLARTADPVRFAPALVIGAERYATLMESELASAGFAGARMVLEPSARNTAPAIALAAIAMAERETCMLVMPSDHVIRDLSAFFAALDTALPAAQAGWLVTFGVEPTGPETGFGYIETGLPLTALPGVSRAVRFIEKPQRDKARAMLEKGNHVWNAGIFLMRADRYLEELSRFQPILVEQAELSMKEVDPSARQMIPDPEQFARCPSISVDYAVMERTDRVACVPVSCGWSDVGSWDALASICKTDLEGNSAIGEVVALECSNSHFHADGVTITASDIHDLIVVANGRYVTLVPKGRSQDVHKIVAALKERAL